MNNFSTDPNDIQANTLGKLYELYLCHLLVSGESFHLFSLYQEKFDVFLWSVDDFYRAVKETLVKYGTLCTIDSDGNVSLVKAS